MNLIDEKIEQYASFYSEEESNILQELDRETNAKVLMPQMLSGKIQGRLLSMISTMLQPKVILEIGTFTGYSAICLAEGLQEGGILHTIDINEELKEMNDRYFKKANLTHSIKQHYGDANIIIPQMNEIFDLVFIDADKINYSKYFDLVIDKVRPGGYIVADNVLWSGKVLNEKKDKDTQALKDYAGKTKKDDRVVNLLLPVRDGLLFSQKV